jgi:hypothetical protein
MRDNRHYVHLALMTALMFVSMYILMYAMVDRLANTAESRLRSVIVPELFLIATMTGLASGFNPLNGPHGFGVTTPRV